jgi:hypothetical protein
MDLMLRLFIPSVSKHERLACVKRRIMIARKRCGGRHGIGREEGEEWPRA